MKPTSIIVKGLTYLFFGLLLFVSCEQDANWITDDGHSKLFAYSEITTEDKIKVFVNTAPGLNTKDDYFYPKQQDAQVTLMREGVILEDPGFRYIKNEKAFISQGAFRPEPGVNYSLMVALKNDLDIEPILGSTMIPEIDFVDNIYLDSARTTQISSNYKEVAIHVRVPVLESVNKFFVLKPFYIDQNGEKASLLVREVKSGNEGCYYSAFNEGLLIDANKIDGEISFSLINDEMLPLNFNLGEMTFEMQTITSEAYQYYKVFAKQVASQTVSLAEPVISFSNFENGLGLFAGYASTVTTIKL